MSFADSISLHCGHFLVANSGAVSMLKVKCYNKIWIVDDDGNFGHKPFSSWLLLAYICNRRHSRPSNLSECPRVNNLKFERKKMPPNFNEINFASVSSSYKTRPTELHREDVELLQIMVIIDRCDQIVGIA